MTASDRPAHRRAGGGALPRAPVERARRRAPAAVRRVPRHLRPRQRRRGRPGAARRTSCGHRAGERPAPALRAGAQRAGHGAHRRRLRPAAATGSQTWAVHGIRRPRLDQHAHRRRPRDDQPDPGAAPARPAPSPPGSRPGAPGARAAARRATSPSTTPSGRCRGSSTGSTAPSSCPSALLGAMRVLTDPVETGAVTIALPQDVQAEAFDWPVELFAERVWHVARPPAEAVADRGVAADVRPVRAAPAGRRRRRGPLLRRRGRARARSAEATGIPVGRDPGRQGLAAARPPAARRSGRARPAPRPPTRSPARPTSSSASARAGPTSPPRREPPSRTAESASSTSTSPRFDAGKHAGLSVVADAREAPDRPHRRRSTGTRSSPAYARPRQAALWAEWDAQVAAAYDPPAEVTDAARAGPAHPGARCSGRSTSSPTRVTSSSARPARCPATCTSCGGSATARATTSSTATPAWATRSPAPSGVRARRRRPATCSRWSATAAT